MKRKMILALLAAMTLTVGSVGTVFAATNNGGAEVQTSAPEQHTHTWGAPVYVVDQEAVYGPSEWIIDKEAEYEQIKVVDKEAWTEEITEVQDICYSCEAKGIHTQFVNGVVVGTGESLQDHVTAHMLNGESGQYGSRVVVVDTIYHPEEYHYENGALISPEEGHWTEAPLITPEQGHWEHTCEGCGEIQNSETGEVIKPGTVTTPENPGAEKPGTETPENPDTNTPTNPDTENPDTEAPANPGTDTEKPSGDHTQKPTEDTEKPIGENEGGQDQTDQNKEENTQNTAEETTDNKNTDTQNAVTGEEVTPVNTQAETTESNESGEKKSPKTGDPANFIYLATLAGSALTGGTAFGLRKKFKK